MGEARRLVSERGAGDSVVPGSGGRHWAGWAAITSWRIKPGEQVCEKTQFGFQHPEMLQDIRVEIPSSSRVCRGGLLRERSAKAHSAVGRHHPTVTGPQVCLPSSLLTQSTDSRAA